MRNRPKQTECTCPPDFEAEDWKCCELCEFEAYADREYDRMRDERDDPRELYLEKMEHRS